MRSLRIALAFLTRIPLTPAQPITFPAPSIAVAFPVAGAIIGGLIGGIYWLSAQALPSTPSAVIAIGVGIIVTGGFHEDGLADTFDALGGGHDREDVLRIFKDSLLGTFGVAALASALMLKVTLLGSLGAVAGLFTLIAAHSLARGVTAATMAFARPASSGLGTSLMAGFERRHALLVAAIGLVVGVALTGGVAVAAFAATAIIAVLLVRWATAKAGGITGDVLGAIEQFGEMTMLLAAVALAEQWSIPWWA